MIYLLLSCHLNSQEIFFLLLADNCIISEVPKLLFFFFIILPSSPNCASVLAYIQAIVLFIFLFIT